MNYRRLNEPLVSIITPSLNQGKYIEKTILSVLEQDYNKIEYIIVDGGSSDNTIEIIKKYENKIDLLISEPDQGQSEAILKGFAKSNGTILSWLCSDDLIFPSTVRTIVQKFQLFPEIGVVYGDRVIIDKKGNIIDILRLPSFWNNMLKMGITIPQETAYFRRDLFYKVGGLDVNLHGAMDYDLWCKLANVTNFLHISEYLGCYRIHKKAKSYFITDETNKKYNIYLQEFIEVYRRHFNCNIPSKVTRKIINIEKKWRLIIEDIKKYLKKIVTVQRQKQKK